MAYQLNPKSLVRLRALIAAGKFVDRPWSFTAADSNALLGDPPKWVEFGNWFLGLDESAEKETKARYGYPFGKGGNVYLSALRAIASRAAAQGAKDVADAASAELAKAKAKTKDKKAAAGAEAADLTGAGASDLEASMQTAALCECLSETREAMGAANGVMRTYAGDPAMSEAVRVANVCASACNALIQSSGGEWGYVGRTSALPSASLIEACRESAEACAAECDSHHNDVCDACAAACRVCAAACELAVEAFSAPGGAADPAPKAKKKDSAAADAAAGGAGPVVKAVCRTAKRQAARPAIAAAADPRDPQRLTLTTPVTITAADDAGGEAQGAATFSMVAYTGGAMRLKGWKFPVVIDLDGVEGTDKARPALKDHDPAQPVGHMPAGSIKVTTGKGGKVTADGVISGHGPHVDQVVESGKKKFPWQASVGAKVNQVQFVPKGRSAQANGKTFEGPIFIARRTSLGEISFVSMGADDNTSARIAAKAAKDSAMNFEQWLEAMGLAAAGLSDDQKAKLQAKYDKEQQDLAAAEKAECEDEEEMEGEDDDEEEEDDKEEAPPSKKKPAKGKMKAKGKKAKAGRLGLDLTAMRLDAAKEIRAAHASESKRIGKIRTVCAGRHAEIEAKAIEEGWDENKTELAVLRAERPKAGQGGQNGAAAVNASFGINVGAGSDATPEIVAAAAAISAGVGEKAAFAGLNDQQKNVAGSRKVRQSLGSMYGLCSFIAATHGVRLPASRMEDDVIRAMFRLDRKVQELDITADGAAGGYSTMSLSGITENILNKAMLEAYGTVDSVVADIAYETDTNDFKQFKRYRLTSSGILAALGAAGELKSISLQDESYANQVKTQGVILTIGRDILLNDDMGALTQGPTLLGRGSALYREMMVFATLLTGTTTVAPGGSTGQPANAFNFFSAGAKNYLTGAGSVLAIPGVTTAVQKFREQTDANGMPIMLKPDRLLVPPALEVPADNLFNGANLVVGALGSTTSKSIEPNINAHKGKYRPVVSPFLSATVAASLTKFAKNDPNYANFSAASDTGWYLLPNPSGGFAPVQVGYLRGQRAPIIERGEANFNTLGIAMRCYYDFGTALHDYRCAVFSAGA